jgi:hypothetical protein
MAVKFVHEVSFFMRVGFFLTCRKILGHGTDGFTFPPKEAVLRNFIALKNPSYSARDIWYGMVWYVCLSQYSVWLRTGRLGDWGSIPGWGKRILPLTRVQTGCGVHPAYCTMGTGGPFPRRKERSGRDADHSSHLMSRSWMSRSYTSSPPS